MDEFALEPQTGAGVGEMSPRDPALPDRAFGQPLVEAGERILGGGEWCRFYFPISTAQTLYIV